MIAELQQRSFDAQWMADFSPSGRFVPVTVDNRVYWYFDQPDGKGAQKRRYVGPVDDPEISVRVASFKELKDDYKSRRKIVSTLKREAGLSGPDHFTGDVVEAFANAGLFRLRGVIVGTVAFQCYSALLGVRLPAAAAMTGDADLAQDYAISTEVADSLPPILDLLTGIDPTFRALPHISGSSQSNTFRNSAGYRVEFLTTSRGSDEYLDEPTSMPALGGASAEPLRFLDFPLRDPVRTILLHGAGVSVVIPAPERFAVHKLIVASRRPEGVGGRAKRDKDVQQAGILFEALQDTGRGRDLAEAFDEAWDRGPHWRAAISTGIDLIQSKSARVAIEKIYRSPRAH